jgi:DNA polymerase-3 subunit epsilon
MSRQVFLDTETTGLEPTKGHRLTEIGCLEMINRKLTGRTFQTYLNPERELDAAAADITGLTFEFLKDKPKFIEVADDFMTFIEGAELIIHNAPFDLGFLNSELGRLNPVWQALESRFTIFDTLVLARNMHPGQKNNLDALCKRYSVDNTHRQYHGALLDAQILAKVYLSMTSGQSSLSFGIENESDSDALNSQASRGAFKEMSYPAIVRFGDLKIIQATEAELQAHEQLMSEIS